MRPQLTLARSATSPPCSECGARRGLDSGCWAFKTNADGSISNVTSLLFMWCTSWVERCVLDAQQQLLLAYSAASLAFLLMLMQDNSRDAPRRIVMPAFTAVAYVPALILERPLFLRERNDGLYRVITYLSFKISAVR